MPTVYRTMKRAEDGLPVVGSKSKELGVRVPPTPHADVDVDGGLVVVNGKGMSVAEHWRNMPGHLVPRRFKPWLPQATGSNSLVCYKMGEGGFEGATLTADLDVVVKPHDPRGAVIAPARVMSIADFQAALAVTRTRWRAEEPES